MYTISCALKLPSVQHIVHHSIFLLDNMKILWHSGNMFNSSNKKITNFANCFLQPTNSTHRQYEALRAYFVDQLPSKQAAKRFGYTDGSFRVLVHQFRKNPQRQFFLPPAKGPHKAPKKDKLRNNIITLRKQNLSIYDISKVLKTQGHQMSPVNISLI